MNDETTNETKDKKENKKNPIQRLKEGLIKASVPITFMVLFLIIGLAPLYVMYGIIDRNIPVKTQ